MLKNLIVFFLAFVYGPAFGASLCVQLDANVTGTGFTSEDDGPGFTVTEANGINIIGLGVCSTTTAADFSNTANKIKFADGGNTECWCRMISPAVSKWVFYYSYGESAICENRCSYRCGDFVNKNASIRSSMFTNITR